MNDNNFQSNEDLENKCLKEYEQGCYSPKLVNIDDFDIDTSKCCILEVDDWKKLNEQRQSIIKSNSVNSNDHNVFDELIRKIGSLTDDDLIVNDVVRLIFSNRLLQEYNTWMYQYQNHRY
ncbi:unnamed protein product [Rotaria sp. Silwood1]|nr:unnamed protein product [Rotaria sp. Silwood1]